MKNKDNKNYSPSQSSPKGGKRACLCKNKNTYSRKCCKGDVTNQGIGNV